MIVKDHWRILFFCVNDNSNYTRNYLPYCVVKCRSEKFGFLDGILEEEVTET